MRWWRYVWAAPTTFVGLLVATAVVLVRGHARIVDGVIEVHGPVLDRVLARLPFVHGIAALTLGHVVLGRNAGCLEATRAHERVHVRQCERWGLFFIPAYLVASGWAILRGGHAYWDNGFEAEARAAVGSRRTWV